MTRNIVLALVAALVAYSMVQVIEAVVPEQPPAKARAGPSLGMAQS